MHHCSAEFHVEMAEQTKGKNYQSALFQSRQASMDAIVSVSITNYKDKEFLNSLWCPDKCDDWFSSVKNNETMNSFSRKDAVKLGELIEEVRPLKHLN
jgi:hypothetical protein